MRCLRYVILFSSIVLAPLNTLLADDHPIIFLHGIQNPATPGNGWPTWNSSNSAMMKIKDAQYNGYKMGLTSSGELANECDKNTQLQTMPDSKRIYNFSYYNSDGSCGVIGSNGNYYPAVYTSDYNASANNACWAEHLSDFIDTVLNATGASKVDIVAHSMGGLVARAAITYYGCENKVRKLLTVGTPNDEFEDNGFIEAVISHIGYQEFQSKGSLLEMGINYDGPSGYVHFRDADNPNAVASYCDWLWFNDPRVNTVCIAGDKCPSWSELFGDNDGLVKVTKAHLSYAQFNPTIYATHSRGWTDWNEEALTTCTYTTEYIKKWMIDDEVLPDLNFTSTCFTVPDPYVEYELYIYFSNNLNSWDPILSTVATIRNVALDRIYQKGYGWHSHSEEYKSWLEPVLCLAPNFPLGGYILNVVHQNMQEGNVEEYEITFGVIPGPAAYVHFNIPYLSFIAGDKIQITNIDLGANHPDDTTYYYRWKNQSYQECDLDGSGRWVVPRPSSPENDTIILKCVVELDLVTYLKCWKRTRVRPRAAPVNVTLNYNGKSVKISWDEMSENDYYEIWRAVLVKGEEKGWGMVGTSPSSPFYDYTLPEGNHTYRYYVRGNFTYFSVDAPEISIYHLNPPTDLKAEIAGNVVELTWDDNSNINAGYEIKRRDIAGNENNWSVGDVESEIDDGVDPNHPAYIYWVRAFDNEGYTSSWAGPVTAKFDETPPNVNITTPGQYRVVYQGLFTVRWNVSDDFGYGVSSQKLYYPYHHSVNLEGDVRSREVNLQTTGRGSEEEIILKATDYAFNTGEDANTVVIIDPNQTNYPLWLSHDDNWYITITTEHGKVAQRLFNRVYKGKGNNWSRINISKRNCWRDPNPLNEGQTRNYLVCLNDFDSLSDIKTVTRPANPHPCPVLYSFTGDSYEQDNSLLPASEFTHQLTRDYYILKKNPKEIDGAYKFEIIEGVDNTYIDLIKLRVIDHPKEVKIGALPNGEVIPIKPSILPFKAIDKKGKDWKDSLLTEGRGYYYGKKGDYLDAYFREKGNYLYTILAPPKDPVESRSGSKGSMMLYSRMNGSANLLQSPDSVIRFLPKDSLCRIDYVRKAFRLPDILIREKEASPEGLPLEITKEDSLYYHLSPGDTLKINFKAVDPAPLLSRSYCLEVVGYYLPVDESKGSKEREQREKVYESYIRPSSSIFTGNILLNASSNERRTVKIEVIDRIGRIVKQKDVRLSRGEQMINLGELKSGIYFIKVSAERGDIHKITVIR